MGDAGVSSWRIAFHAAKLMACTVLAGVLLQGCADRGYYSPVSVAQMRPDPKWPPMSMLRAQPSPKCRRQVEPGGDGEMSEEDKLRARIAQLEFERQCYRQYEIQARYRLEQLQAAARRMMTADRHYKLAER
ncbi:MAG: hypothetical protein AB7O43_18555 [Hyphomicrobiaceae bacterium]